MSPHVDDLFSKLSNAEPHQVEAILAESQQRIDDDAGLGLSLLRANLMVNMAGQLFVHDIEVGDRVRKLNHEQGSTFLRLAFPEAVEAFLARRLVTADEFEKLAEAERSRAFAIKNAATQSFLGRIRDAIARALEPGGAGLRAFIEDFRTTATSRLTPAYLENVYRTSTATSYQSGRLRQMQDPDVTAVLEYWEYVSVNDSRTRPEHAELHGKVWKANDPDALAHYPPLGYQCRCTMITREAGEFDAAQLSRGVPEGAITPGFGQSPAERIADEAAAL